jgi:hypothetical protein
MGRIAGCFARRETRLTCRDMVRAQLMELFTDRRARIAALTC